MMVVNYLMVVRVVVVVAVVRGEVTTKANASIPGFFRLAVAASVVIKVVIDAEPSWGLVLMCGTALAFPCDFYV
jgi:hypothetical protein